MEKYLKANELANLAVVIVEKQLAECSAFDKAEVLAIAMTLVNVEVNRVVNAQKDKR